MDMTQIQFICTNPHRYGDGSFKFEVVMIMPSMIGGPSAIVGTADVMVATDKACEAMARALAQIATQLPPELAVPK